MDASTVTGFRLSPQQRRLCLLQQNASVYNARALVSIEGRLDIDRLRQAIDSVVNCYEILRTTFPSKPGSAFPVQAVSERLPPRWSQLDLSDREPVAQASACDEQLAAEAQMGFDLQRDSPLRLKLFRLSASNHALLMTMPTLCADAWSLVTLLQKIKEAYAAIGVGSPWSSDPLQYADLAEWQNELLISDEQDAKAGRSYWANWHEACLKAGMARQSNKAELSAPQISDP